MEQHSTFFYFAFKTSAIIFKKLVKATTTYVNMQTPKYTSNGQFEHQVSKLTVARIIQKALSFHLGDLPLPLYSLLV